MKIPNSHRKYNKHYYHTPCSDIILRTIIAKNILKACDIYNVDPAIIIGQIDTESNFNPFCVGKLKEIGLMQLHPVHQASAIKAMGLKPYEAFYIRNNITLGVKYTKEQLTRFNGNVSLALSGYNAGPNATIKLRKIPNNTAENYVRNVLSVYADIKNTYKGS